ncbi:MAG: hypothetical protein AB7I33_12045 [Gemmatimonadales bacterium]
MAIDTAAKRSAMLNFSSGDLLPIPQGAFDEAGRLQLLDLYEPGGTPPPPGPSSGGNIVPGMVVNVGSILNR